MKRRSFLSSALTLLCLPTSLKICPYTFEEYSIEEFYNGYKFYNGNSVVGWYNTGAVRNKTFITGTNKSVNDIEKIIQQLLPGSYHRERGYYTSDSADLFDWRNTQNELIASLYPNRIITDPVGVLETKLFYLAVLNQNFSPIQAAWKLHYIRYALM